MKPISPRPIFTLSLLTAANHKAAKIPHVVEFSTYSGNQHHHLRRQEDESRLVRVSVWWDFENCNVPVNGNAFRVAQSITNAIRANGIKGPIEITAFGDVMQISRTNQEALSATGINLTHVPSGGKNSADRSLLVDLMYWVAKNPPPAHLLLISGDRDFAGILHRLRMSNYNILLASPDSAPNVLCSAATIMWQWSSLLKGENLTGKLFNQPPDGPYNSWYGHYKAPLVDPFAVTEQSLCASADESSLLAASEPKLRPIPVAVMDKIHQILGSYPEGINIAQLRTELAQIDLNTDLYGYKKFSHFLAAMPHILEICREDKGIVVRRVNTKFSDELLLGTSKKPGTDNRGSDVCSDTRINSEKSSCEDVAENFTVGPVLDRKVKGKVTNFQEVPKAQKQIEPFVSTKMQDVKMETCATNLTDRKRERVQRESLSKKNIQEEIEEDRKVKLKDQIQKDEVAAPPPVAEVKDLSEKNGDKLHVLDDHTSASEVGFFRRMWMKLFGSRDDKLKEASSGKDTVTRKTHIPCESSEAIPPALFSPSNHEARDDRKFAQSGDASSDTSIKDSSSSNESSSWFKFWSSSKSEDKAGENEKKKEHLQVNIKHLDEKNEEKNGEAAHVKVKTNQLEVFATESFWKEMESFIKWGSSIFSKSRTRENLALNLQKQGPQVLRSLSISDLLQLIDLLISDKKWVEERDFGRYPFRITYQAGKSVQMPSSSNGLSHIFSERVANTQDSKERKHQNPPHPGVHKRSSSKPKYDVLADSKNLVNQIVKEYPEGFNIGGFRKLFLERYGYALDLQKLGHEKLATFLRIIPGVVLESNLILPADALKNLSGQELKIDPLVDSNGNSLIMSKNDDESDSTWDELGPLDTSGSEKDEIDAQETGKSQKGTEKGFQYYEPLREDDLSDSDEDTAYTRSEDESKSIGPGQSELLSILDSWHGQKGSDGNRDEPTSLIDSVETDSELSEASSSLTRNGSEGAKPTTRKLKSQKSYSFVKEPTVDRNDKLIHGILGSLKNRSDKSADSQVHN